MSPGDLSIQDIYNRTLLYAAEAHRGQLFPGTLLPYLVHVAMVADEVVLAHQEEAIEGIHRALQMALLHDVLEDTSVTAQELSSHFEQAVVDGVVLLSKTCNGQKLAFGEYIDRLSSAGRDVALVKLCDRITNLQPPPKFWKAEKIAAYLEESKIILGALGRRHSYAARRLASKIEEYRQYL